MAFFATTLLPQIVHNRNIMPDSQTPVSDMRANETCAARHQNTHRFSFSLFSAVPSITSIEQKILYHSLSIYVQLVLSLALVMKMS